MFCAHRLIMLYICTKFHQSISNGFRVSDPDSRVNARVVANVYRWTYDQTKPDPYIAPRLWQARQN